MELPKLQKIDWNSSEYFARPFVSREDIDKYYCLICGYNIDGDEAFNVHINGKSHADALKKYGHRITPLEDDHYYCSHCRCIIADYTCVYAHLIGLRHRILQLANSKINSIESQVVDWTLYENFACPFVLRKNTGTYFCIICDCYIIGVKAFNEHIHEKRHIDSLENSHYIWLVKNKQFYCGLCDCSIGNFLNVHKHIIGITHQSFLNANGTTTKSSRMQPIDWTSREYFACPFVFHDTDGKYYCSICDYDIIDYEAFIEHIEGERHTDVLIRHGHYISPLKQGWFYCSRCDCLILHYSRIRTHVIARKHQGFLNTRKSILNSSTVQRIDWTSCRYFACPFVFHETAEKYYCSVCDCNVVGEKAFNEHIEDEHHTNAIRRHIPYISPVENDLFFCSQCDCTIGNHSRIYIHVKGRRHAKLLNEKSSNLQPMDWTSCEYFVGPFISHENIGRYYCLLCGCNLIGDKSFDYHIRGELHAKALRQHGSYMLLCEDYRYYCGCCDCFIPDYTKVHGHVRTIKHQRSLYEKLKTKTKKLPSIDWTSSEYFACPFVSHENVEEYYCLICDCTIFGDKTFNNHVHGKSHVAAVKKDGCYISALEDDSCYCAGCDCIISNYIKVHDHIKRQNHTLQCELHEQRKRKEEKKNSKSSETAKTGESNDRGTNDQSSQTRSPYSNTSNKVEATTISLEESGIEEMPQKKATRSKIKGISSKKAFNIREVVDLLDCYKDIYDMKDRVREIKLGMKLCLVNETKKNYYCIICRQMIDSMLEKCIEHLCDFNHCDYLEGMLNDHTQFKPGHGEFSEFGLAYQYMENTSRFTTRCFVCNEDINRIGYPLQNHIDKDSHRKRCEEMDKKTTQIFEAITSRLHCDWYKVQRYRCEPCSVNFDSETDFAEHLESDEHEMILAKLENSETVLIYDFCELCALLWYGYRCTYAFHCEGLTHKWIIRYGYHKLPDLPDSATHFLFQSKIHLEDMINYLDKIFVREETDYKMLMKDLGNMVKSKFPEANVCTFGSRVSSSSSLDLCIDVFLGCESIYDGKTSLDREILHFMRSVHQCMKDDPQTWDLKELLTSIHSPIIKARHRTTGVSCEISFENGLVVDGVKLIKFFNYIFPPCQKLLLFLKRWLTLCNLSGDQRISIYALYWSLIFYLQKDSRVPSIASMIAMEETSNIIAEKSANVFDNFICNKAKGSFSNKELLIGFFKFYANFDFRYNVACPVLGDVVKKQAFGDVEHLPKEMRSYIVYMKNFDHPEPLRIDCAMCIQDPFMLQHNLTKALRKVDLIRFRKYCSKSLDLLCLS